MGSRYPQQAVQADAAFSVVNSNNGVYNDPSGDLCTETAQLNESLGISAARGGWLFVECI